MLIFSCETGRADGARRSSPSTISRSIPGCTNLTAKSTRASSLIEFSTEQIPPKSTLLPTVQESINNRTNIEPAGIIYPCKLSPIINRNREYARIYVTYVFFIFRVCEYQHLSRKILTLSPRCKFAKRTRAIRNKNNGRATSSSNVSFRNDHAWRIRNCRVGHYCYQLMLTQDRFMVHTFNISMNSQAQQRRCRTAFPVR